MTMNFDLENTRRDLIAKRAEVGANTPAGHRCSNIVEQLQNYVDASPEQKAALEPRIEQQMRDLERLTGTQN